ncbi:hypothetical protein MVEN_00552200 [Mycena venus]|uniref:Uncharacterized protein n=1 Tax=Mycena venus TaxID=2733690 RepID=A0A8H7D7W8_9AGAR|nr:hypothetical protein MVEN_00552200 [Mycena venus]
MNYSYYRQNPTWGTDQLQFGQPPPPSFQPQPNWGGQDFYNAHAINPDSSLYDHAWNRVRSYSGSAVEQGVGMHEAKHWHRRAYGGLGELGQMQPEEIGHAAAYEAYRTWIHNSSMYEPLSGDVERQREGLIGLAVAEASRLLQFANRGMDQYARTAASESAAATASIIFYHSRERDEGDYHRSRSRRRGSFASSYEEDDPYASDLRAMSSHFPRHRSRSRHRSHSTSSRHSPLMQYGSMPNVAPMPIPGAVPSGYGGAPAQYGTPYGVPMQIHGQASSYQGSSYGSASGMPMAVNQPYNSVPMVLPMGRQRSTSMSIPYTQAQYPQVQYVQGVQGQYMMPRMAQPQPTTIIIGGSGHRKHHRSKKSKRSRSTDYPRVYTTARY